MKIFLDILFHIIIPMIGGVLFGTSLLFLIDYIKGKVKKGYLYNISYIYRSENGFHLANSIVCSSQQASKYDLEKFSANIKLELRLENNLTILDVSLVNNKYDYKNFENDSFVTEVENNEKN